MAANLHGCVLAILVENGTDARHIERIRDQLRDLGARVHLLGAQSSPAKTLHGKTLDVDAFAAGVSPRYYDGLVLPGTAKRDPAFDNEEIVALLQAFSTERRPMGAIGDGIMLLADAGLLEGRRVACSDVTSKIVSESGAKRVPEAVTNDRVIITARDFDAIPEFCRIFAQEIVAYRKRDYVDEVSIESFPGSDAPSNSAI